MTPLPTSPKPETVHCLSFRLQKESSSQNTPLIQLQRHQKSDGLRNRESGVQLEPKKACQAAVSGVMTDGIERELHLTSFFLFLTLGIFPSFIFLGFFFFCCLSDSSSEKKLLSGVRGTVFRSTSSSSSRHTETKYYLL